MITSTQMVEKLLQLASALGCRDSHLNRLLKVPTLKAGLKLKGEVGVVFIRSGALNGPPASSNTGAGEIETHSGLKERT